MRRRRELLLHLLRVPRPSRRAGAGPALRGRPLRRARRPGRGRRAAASSSLVLGGDLRSSGRGARGLGGGRGGGGGGGRRGGCRGSSSSGGELRRPDHYRRRRGEVFEKRWDYCCQGGRVVRIGGYFLPFLLHQRRRPLRPVGSLRDVLEGRALPPPARRALSYLRPERAPPFGPGPAGRARRRVPGARGEDRGGRRLGG